MSEVTPSEQQDGGHRLPEPVGHGEPASLTDGPDGAEALARLSVLLHAEEDWLMRRILHYAGRQDYTRYTSTLVCAWQMSISGLTEALVATGPPGQPLDIEFAAHADHGDHPLARFAVDEALVHRRRGIDLGMFLGLLKYYRQTYLDLVHARCAGGPDLERLRHIVLRRFDLFEIELVTAWNRTPLEDALQDLSRANREITNEKNLYLTAFESLQDPAFIVDDRLVVGRLNQAAESLLADEFVPAGESYYRRRAELCDLSAPAPLDPGGPAPAASNPVGRRLVDSLPDLAGVLSMSPRGPVPLHREAAVTVRGRRYDFLVSQCPMQDVSGKFSGSVVFLSDISDRRLMEDELRRLAEHDMLTGAANRRRLYRLAEVELARAVRTGVPTCVIAMDLDHFKRVNDEHGHRAGDTVLSSISARVMNLLRPYDSFARVGGEEFVVLLPQIRAEEASRIAERFRVAIADTPIDVGGVPLKITASMGVAEGRPGESSVDDLLNAADGALYRAKSAGRNRVCRADLAGHVGAAGAQGAVADHDRPCRVDLHRRP